MRDRSPQEFIDDLTYGMEQTFSFRGRTYFVEVSTEPNGTWFAHMDRWRPDPEAYVDVSRPYHGGTRRGVRKVSTLRWAYFLAGGGRDDLAVRVG